MKLIFDVQYPMSGGDLRQWRERLGLNRYQAGLLLDLSERMFSYYENGHREIPFSTYINCLAYENWLVLNRRVDDILESRNKIKNDPRICARA